MSTPSTFNVRLPVPTFWRQGDLDKIAKAMNSRSVVLGETNPVFPAKDLGRFYEIKTPTHRLENFKSSDGKLTADVKILDIDVLLAINESTDFTFSVRRNNDVFAKDEKYCHTAPGLITFDLRVKQPQ